MTQTQPTDRVVDQQDASVRPSPVTPTVATRVGLDAPTNADAQGGKLPSEPQTLKTFTLDLDDWQLP
jgi:hypothetical protein